MKVAFAISLVFVLLINNTMAYALQDIRSPLMQFRSGTNAVDVRCQDGFQLLIKKSDSSPVCVTQSTFQKLLLRNWGYDPKDQGWKIIGLNDTYKIGQRIDFTIKYNGYVSCCISPDTIVTGINGTTSWQTHFSHVCSCPAGIIGQPPPPARYYSLTWNVNDLGFGILSINKTGNYTINVADNLKRNITVIP